MKNAIAIAAIAGLATVASADSLNANLSFADASIAVGGTTTATLTVDFTVDSGSAASYLAWVNINILGDDGIASASGLSLNAALSNVSPAAGTAAGSGVAGLFMQSSSFFGAVDFTNPVVVASWTVTGDAAGVLTYQASVHDQGPAAFQTIDGADGPFGVGIDFGTDAFSSGSLDIVGIPAPSAMALLGLGGVVAGRRRR